MLPYTESTKQTYIIRKLLTSGNLAPASPIASFTGPVIVVDGGEDGIFCGDNWLWSITAQPDEPGDLGRGEELSGSESVRGHCFEGDGTCDQFALLGEGGL